MKERYLLLITLTLFGLIGLGLFVANAVQPLPAPATDRAREVDQLLRVLFGIAIAALVAVQGLLVLAAVRGRLGIGGGEMNGSLEPLWVAIPAAIVVVISVYSVRVLSGIERLEPEAVVIEVTAEQFQWSFHYRGTGVISNELHLPVGRPVRLELTSRDVIHSFWVPEFGGKVDALPGQLTSLTVTPKVLGEYEAVCAELCGPGHTRMVARVHVEGASDYEAWLAEQ